MRGRILEGVKQATPASRECQRGLAISPRDLRIIDRTLAKLARSRVDFAEALRALREAVEEAIPDGRIFLLGHTTNGPMLGSIISGVGIVDHPAGVQVVRAKPGDAPTMLGILQR